MHPVLLNIPVQYVAPWLSMPVIFLATAVVGWLTYRRARADGANSGDAINNAALPVGVTAVVLYIMARSTKPWPLHTYGVLIAAGFVCGIAIAVREARRTNFDEEAVLDMGFWALVSGLVGARIYFIAVNWKEYFVTKPWVYVEQLGREIPAVFAFWQGGLVFYGGALGALLTFFWFARKRNLDVGRFADICIPGLPLGHALGRMGCFAAGCCWGDGAFHVEADGTVVSDFAFAAQFPRESLAFGSLVSTVAPPVHDFMLRTGHTAPLYPTQWMESFGESVIVLILLLVRSRKVFHGQVAATYFLLYPLLRATLEFFRGDTERGYVIDKVLSVGQATSILVALGALGMIVFMVQRNRALAPVAPPAAAAG